MRSYPGALSTGILVLILAVRAAIANPQGPAVVHGNASFTNPAAGRLQINNTPNAIINWQSFSIGGAETTRFVQPSAASAVLNRVVGGDLSAIYGQLLSNGRVFLINPAGIVFGPNAVVDTAGLIASTLQMTDADFIAGRMRFAEVGQAGGIENHGLIHAGPGGEVVFIAPDIENSGIISVDGGQLILAAGRKLTLTSLDTRDIAFEVQAPEDQVVNLGELLANGGAVGAFAGTLRNRGLVRADSVEMEANGEVVLRASANLTLESGSTVDANGASGGHILIDGGAGAVTLAGQVNAIGASAVGGEVRVTGDHVTVADGASIDVSGASGGGQALLGGARRDQAGSAMPEARVTDVAAGARVAADASLVGNGGEIVVWGRQAARIAGELSARGGPDGGDGGFVETSAGGRLMVLRGPSVGAPAGHAGSWLIDPDDIRIVAGDGLTENLGKPLFTSTAGESQIGATLINEQLDIGSSIEINTSGFGDGSSVGNIIVDAPLLKTATATATTIEEERPPSLVLLAHGDVIVNASIGSTGDPLSVELRGDYLEPDGSGSVTVNAPITTAGGYFRATSGTAGATTLNAPITTAGGSFDASAGGSVTLTGNAPVTTAGGYFRATSGTAGATTLNAPISTAGGWFTATAGESVTLTAAVDTRTQSGSSGGSVSISAGGDVALSGTASGSINAGTNSVYVNAGAGNSFSLSSGASLNAGFVSVTADDVSIAGPVAATGSMRFQPTTSSRPVSVGANAAGSLAMDGGELALLSVGPTSTLTLGNFSAGALTVGGPVSLTAVTNLTLQGASLNQAAGAAISVPGRFTASINGAATYAAAINAGTGMSFVGTDTIMSGAYSTAAGTLSVSADTLDLTVGTLSAGGSSGLVRIQPRSFRPVDLGSETVGSLSITDAELNQMTAPRIEIGGRFSASRLTVSQPVSALAAGALALVSRGNVSQAGGAVITAPNLRVASTFGNVTLNEANLVDTLAGTASGSFSFTNAQPLTVSTVDGVRGISASTVTLDAGSFDFQADVNAFSSATLSSGGAAIDVGMGNFNRVSTSALTLLTDDFAASSPVTLPVNTLLIAPFTSGTQVNVGSSSGTGTLGFLPAALNNLTLNAGATVTIGDEVNTGDLTVTAPTTITAFNNLRLVASADIDVQAALTLPGSVGVVADVIQFNALVSAPTVTAEARTGSNLLIDPMFVNQVAATNLVLGGAMTGDLSLAGPIAPGAITNLTLQGQSLTLAGGDTITVPGDLTILADDVELGDNVSSSGGGRITIAPRTFRAVDIGTETAGRLSLTAAELARAMTSGTLQIGDSANTGPLEVSAPVSAPAALALVSRSTVSQSSGAVLTAPNLGVSTFGNVTLNEANLVDTLAGTASGSFSFTNAQPLTVSTVDGVRGISASTVTLDAGSFDFQENVNAFSSATLSSGGAAIDVGMGNFNRVSTSSLTLLTDDFAASVPVTLPVNTLVIAPFTSGTQVDVGSGSGTGTLGILLAALNNLTLNAGATVTIGDAVNTGDLTVVAPAAITAFDNLRLVAGADVVVGAALTLPGSVGVVSDSIQFNDLVSAPTVSVEALTAGVPVDALPLVNQVAATDLVLGGAATGAVLLGGSIAPSAVTNLTLQGQSLTLAAGDTITVPGDLTIFADDVDLGGNVNSTAGGRITIAPRTFNRAVDVGTETAGPGQLSITAAELARVVTSGTLQVGESNNTGVLNVSAPVSALAAGGALALVSRSNVSQAGGAVITAPNLRVASTFGSVTLNEANLVDDTLAGTASGSFSFTNAQPLTVSTVDGVSGIAAGGTVTLEADILSIGANVSGGTVTLEADNLSIGANVSGSSTVNLTGDVIELLGNVSGATTNLVPITAGRGISLGAEVAGSLSFTNAELNKVIGNTLNIGDSSTGPITVAAAVEPTSVNHLNLVSAGNTINVNAPLTAQYNIDLKSDAINILAELVSRFGNITMRPLSAGLPIVLGSKTSGALSLSAAELALIGIRDFGSLTIGATDAGAVAIEVPIAFVHDLILLSGAGITQGSGATITASRLGIFAGGAVNLPADNDVGSFFASVSGSGNDLVFNNLKPLRLQDVFGSAGTDGGRVIITAGRSAVAEAFEGEGELPDIIDLVLALQEDSDKLKKKSGESEDGEESEDSEEILQCS